MLRLATATIFAYMVIMSDAWSPSMKQSNPISPKNNNQQMKNLMKNVVSAGVAASIVFGTTIGNPNIASAVDFTGSFSDPRHPFCTRLVAVEGTDALVSGTDGNPECIGGEGRPWKLIGKVDGDKISVDFSPTGGPKDLNGKWEDGKKSGIRWPDGNKWILEARP